MNLVIGGACLALAAGVALSACAPGDSPPVPRGWRVVEDGDLGSRNARAFRNGPRGDYLTAIGDFDGDGRDDRAGFLINEADGTAGLFIFPATSGPVLAETLDSMATMGVAAAPGHGGLPACARNAAGCGDSSVVTVPHDVVVLFVTDTVATFYYLVDGRPQRL